MSDTKELFFIVAFSNALGTYIKTMMKKLSLLLLSLVIITFSACKKEETSDDKSPTPYQPKGYIPLKVGSYWIYQTFIESSQGNDSALAIIDSTYISGTIVINSKTYYISERDGLVKSTVYVRDSLGYLVDTLGSTIMSDVNFKDTIISKTEYLASSGLTLYHISRMMYDEQKTVSVPAGTFNNCIEARDWLKIYFGTPAQPNPFYYHNYYAKDIGLLEYNYRYSGSARMYKVKLIRYYIPN